MHRMHLQIQSRISFVIFRKLLIVVDLRLIWLQGIYSLTVIYRLPTLIWCDLLDIHLELGISVFFFSSIHHHGIDLF